MSAKDEVCAEIAEIMETYREQEKRPGGVDTPGGLEHMGDVWRMFRRWDDAIKETSKAAQLLALPMEPNDAEAATVRDYLKAILTRLLTEQDGFSGKRPFGNSGWIYDLYRPMIQAGLVVGTLDENGCVETLDEHKADEMLLQAIQSL